MIMYKFGEVECKIQWEEFLSVKTTEIQYKSDFKNFNTFYEFLDKNIKIIKELLFNGYKYILENGILHNLYEPSLIRISGPKTFAPNSTSRLYYIDGGLVCWKMSERCRNRDQFEKKEIFHFEELTNKQSGRDVDTGVWYRRKEGIDYIKHYINLEYRRKQDQRSKKLNRILKNTNDKIYFSTKLGKN